MGIDIYLNNREVERQRKAIMATEFDTAVKMRDSYRDRDCVEAKAAQELVSAAYEKAYSAKLGYLRSSYNSGGLFNVLDQIFGLDSGAYLFPGDWSTGALRINWREFVSRVEKLQEIAKYLTDGVPLPVKFDELGDATNTQRQGGETFGKSVMQMMGALCGQHGLSVEAGHNPRPVFNAEDHGWYVTDGLRELHEFGQLGLELVAQGKRPTVRISY